MEPQQRKQEGRWSTTRSLLLSRTMVNLFLLILLVASLTLPFILREYAHYAGNMSVLRLPVMASLWACAVPAFFALYQLRRMLWHISMDRVFIPENIRSLRIISWCCFLVACIFLLFCFYYILGLILAILAAFMGLILRVVKNVFAQALAIKEENDLTV